MKNCSVYLISQVVVVFGKKVGYGENFSRISAKIIILETEDRIVVMKSEVIVNNALELVLSNP